MKSTKLLLASCASALAMAAVMPSAFAQGEGVETLLARIALKTENHSGFGINPATGNDVDNLSRAMGRIHLNWLPTDNFDILLTGEVYNQNDASAALHFRSEAFVTAPNRLFPIGRTSPVAGAG